MEEAVDACCLDDLPLDVAYQLLQLLSAHERARAACVCRSWRALLSAPAAWTQLDLCSLSDESQLRRVCARAAGELRSLVVSAACRPALVLEVAAANASSLRSLVVELPDVGEAGSPLWREADTALLRVAHLSVPLRAERTVDGEWDDPLEEARRALACGCASALWLERALLTPALTEALTDAALAARPRTALLELSLRFNSVGAAGCAHLSRLLSSSPLHSLLLSVNDVGDAGATHLAAALREPGCRLVTLELHNCQIGSAGARAIASSLAERGRASTLRRLRLAHNRIFAVGAVALARALERGVPLLELDLGHNDIGREGTVAFTPHALRGLTNLRLTFNGICVDAARALAASISRNSSLEELHIGYNGMGDEGLRELTVALRAHPSIRRLSVPVTHIGPEGARRLGGLLRHGRLVDLDASGNALGRPGGLALAAGLAEGSGSLRSLRLRSVRADDAVAHALATALRAGGRGLQSLELDSNAVGDDGARALAAAARIHGALRTITLADNYLGQAERGTQDLREAVEERLGALSIVGI